MELKTYTVTIPIKSPSLNEFLDETSRSYHQRNGTKHKVQNKLAKYLSELPEIKKPVKIWFLWQEADKRRDPDNVGFGQKFLLDEMVKLKRIPNDNWRWIKGLYHDFDYGDSYKVTLTIREVEDDTEGTAHSGNAKARRGHSKDKV